MIILFSKYFFLYDDHIYYSFSHSYYWQLIFMIVFTSDIIFILLFISLSIIILI